MAISDNLQFAFLMNESSGNRVDSIASLVLNQVGTVSSRTGLFGNAADLDSGENLIASAYNSAYRIPTGTSSTVACWVYIDSVGTSGYPMGRWDGGDPNRDWILQVNGSGVLSMQVIETGGASRGAVSGTVTVGGWNLLIGWFDHTVGSFGSVNSQLNNGTVVTANLTATKITTDTTTKLTVGRINPSFGYFGVVDGAVDLACKWSRVLSATERSQLWNSGVGIDYPFIPSTTSRRRAAQASIRSTF